MPDNNIFLSIITVGLDEHQITATLNPLIAGISSSSIESIVVTPFPTDSLQNLLPSSKFVADPKCGVYSAMNEGLRIASGSYVWFLNAGDESLLDGVSLKFMLEDLQRSLIGCSVYNLPIVLFGCGFPYFIDLFCFRILFLRFTLLSLGMPVSHQNMFFARSLHKPFSKKYRYSSDYEIFSDLVFTSRCGILFASSRPIANLVAGGISDSNRLSVFQERFSILIRLVRFPYAPIVVIGFLFRTLRELVASSIKTLIGWR